MQLTRSNALLRAQSFCAKIWQQMQPKPKVKGATLPPLTSHIARDIGLSPGELAEMRHRWPSETTRHPYL
ncbi:hypothetical protein [uncultured Tateyamaria sp.]|uniref:hypothetical protein n=1 Tax=uncultured Tateyamaria sp. TaxID=455651 RepID=UPI002631C689|nr:hypothetical protein [uncultured Tateyamaria sp.]